MIDKRLIGLSVLLTFSGCSDNLDRPIQYNLPSQYSGPFLLIEDSQFETAIRKTTAAYVIDIPPSGIANLGGSDLAIHRKWHAMQACYPDGTKIPWQVDAGFGLHAGPTSTRNNKTYYSWFFLGNKADAEVFFHGRDSGELQKQWLVKHGLQE